MVKVSIRGGNLEQAMRVLNKKLQKEGVFREMKRSRSYEKPSEKRVRLRSESIRRIRKTMRRRGSRD